MPFTPLSEVVDFCKTAYNLGAKLFEAQDGANKFMSNLVRIFWIKLKTINTRTEFMWEVNVIHMISHT